MQTAVVDSSIALKWVISEPDSDAALSLRSRYRFIAPELLIAECSNTLWKRARTQEISAEAVGLAIKLLQADALEIVPMRPLMGTAIRLALAIDHPAYDCLFAALALREQCPFITADVKFLCKARGQNVEIMSLEEAALAIR